ncbi:IS66 family transposase, partial [Paenibacillus sp. HJGM_3]|uniref:IS66 family transposase n=1 Tax=Paenibacillus sp. HJGM_3 TaxID=3379816 RepID=UPI00385EF17B
FDLPAPRMLVTEHRAEKKCCPFCQTAQQAEFPEGIHAPAQYGDGVTAWTAYLHGYHLLPLDRIGQMFEDLTGYRPSDGTLLTSIRNLKQALVPVNQIIQEQLLASPVVHADETGTRVQGKKHWVHTVSSANWTLLAVHCTRGTPAIEAMNVLPRYTGILVHDFYHIYFKDKYRFQHALCNAHLLRECQGIAEHDHHEWSSRMKELLQSAWKQASAARRSRKPLARAAIEEIEQRYDRILREGEAEWSLDVVREKTGPRGRKIKSTAANLGERLRLYKRDILRFLYDTRVPFDNNQAERDIRMVKVKEKISGTFRTTLGADVFASIRSFISTLLKQNRPIIASLQLAYRGHF